MRTTLTLEPDLARLLKEEAHRVGKPFKDVVNDAIRRGLGPRRESKARPYKVRPHTARLAPGLDRAHLNALADEMEDAVVLLKVTSRETRAQ